MFQQIHRDAISVVVGIVVLAMLIAELLLTVNPIR